MSELAEPTTVVRARPARVRWAVAHWSVLVRAYLTLLKPKITMLLTAFGATAALVASATTGGALTGGTLLAFCVIGMLTAGGAACLNHVHDRDIDRLMRRTRNRPIPAGLVSPGVATGVAAACLVLGTALALALLGPLPALLCAIGAAIYGGLYTRVLKRRTVRNIEIGGLAGSCGVLAGWAVVDPGLGAGAWTLAALVYLWTPAHFWGLAIARDADYRAAGVPMLPQVAGVLPTARLMTAYAVLTLLASLALVALTSLGLLYGLVALVGGGSYTALCIGFWRSAEPAAALRVFKASGAYLGLLLLAMVVDGRL